MKAKFSFLFLLVILVLSVLFGSQTQAATINATSCSRTDVVSAINSAASGDNVVVPAGACSWSSAILLPAAKDLTVQGQTIVTCSGTPVTCTANNQTNISCGGGACFTIDLGALHRVTGFTMTGANSGGIGFSGNQNLSKYFRIDHNRIVSNAGWAPMQVKGGSAALHPQGIVDSNILVDIAVHVFGSAYMMDEGDQQNQLWAQQTPLGDSNAVVYIETNHFQGTSANVNNSDSNYGGRRVFRFNNITSGRHTVEVHGMQGDNRGPQRTEIYNNSASGLTGFSGSVFFRGGTGVIFNNTQAAPYSFGILFTNDRSELDDSIPVVGNCDGTHPGTDQNTSGQQGWHCRDQVGVSHDTIQWDLFPSPISYNQVFAPVYAWGNKTGVSQMDVNVDSIGIVRTHIQSNRDYYNESSPFNGISGVGINTLAQRPSTCTAGVAYWATDQGEWNSLQSGPDGQLYRCTSANTWTLYYIPYQYPHPWTGASVPPLPDTQAPTTPTNLTSFAISSSQINLSWIASTDNVGVTGYQVERCQGSGCTSFSQIATLAQISYQDTGLLANTTYRYRVRATDAAGNLSTYSSIVSATTQAASPGNNHYIRAGAAGNGSGTDWTNACTGFSGTCNPTSLSRGDTYYVASGSYAPVEFNTPESGSLTITIKGATAVDHGTNTGWQASFGVDVAQAVFGMPTHISRSYFTFDGNVGPLFSSNPAAYGFKIAKPSNCAAEQNYSQFVNTSPAIITNIVYKHVAIVSCGSAFDGIRQQGIYVGGFVGLSGDSARDILVANNYIEAAITPLIVDRASNVTLEYNYVNGNWSGVFHGTQTQIRNGTDITVRYNYFKSARGTATVSWYDNFALRIAIYGNIVEDAQGGNGVFASGDSGSLSCRDCRVYNNTIVNTPTGFFLQGYPSSSGNIIENNLFWNSAATYQGNGVTNDYNTYLSVVGGFGAPIEPNGQVGSFDPFVNSAARIWNLANGVSVNAGKSLASPYNSDIDGIVRGVDGKWDRGAYEYVSSISDTTPPSPPTGLTVQ